MPTKRIIFYGLSTCPYCRRAKEFLEQHNLTFELYYIDQLTGAERDTAVAAVQALNPQVSFPTILIEDGAERNVVVGFGAETPAELTRLIGL